MNERDIFPAALERDEPATRSAFPREVCGQDSELLAAVQALLRSHEEASKFLWEPAVYQLAGQSVSHQGAGADNGDADATADSPVADASSPHSHDDVLREIPLTILDEPLNSSSLGRLKHYTFWR